MSLDNPNKIIDLEKTSREGNFFSAGSETGLQEIDAGSGAEYRVERTDDLDLRHYLAAVMRRKLLVAIVTILIMGIAAFFILSRPSLYQASTRVQVDYENDGMIAGGRNEPTTFSDRAYFNTQLELLKSPTLIGRALHKLDLKGAPDIALAKPERGLIPSMISSISVTDDAAPSGSAGGSEEDLTLKIGDREQGLAYRLEAINESLTIEPVLKARQAIKDTRLIDIMFQCAEPEVCSLVTNALADELVEMNLEKKMGTHSTENDYLKDNIAELTAKIRQDEQQLLSYGRNYQLPTLDGSQNTVVERLVGLNRQLLEAENERKQAEAAYKASQEADVAKKMAEQGAEEIAAIDNKLDELRQRRAQLLVEVTEKYPDVRVIDKEIAVLEQQAKDRRSRATDLFKTTAETRYRQAVAKEDAIRRSFDQQRGETMVQNEAAINYKIIQQSLETNRKLLGGMMQRSTENEMLRAKVPNNIAVVDYAAVPTEPVDKNNLQYLAIAFVFSLSAGVGLALLRDYFDDGVYSVGEVEKAMSSPTLAVVPGASKGYFAATRRMIGGPSRLRLTDGIDEPIVVSGGPELILNADSRSEISEAFRRLRTALLLSPNFGGMKRILVTSSRKGEGKTTTSINIATSLAEAGSRVLLIDADLRNPRLGEVFSLGDFPGLSEFLMDREGEEDLSENIVSLTPNLDILPAGRVDESSAERLVSGNFEKLLEERSKVYDHIIVDSPPVTSFSDSTVIASMVDGVLMVVQGSKNSQEAVRNSAKLLRQVGARIVGVVLNKVNVRTEAYYSSYGS